MKVIMNVYVCRYCDLLDEILFHLMVGLMVDHLMLNVLNKKFFIRFFDRIKLNNIIQYLLTSLFALILVDKIDSFLNFFHVNVSLD